MFVVLLSIAADGGPSESYDEFRTFKLSRDKNTDSFVFSIFVSKFKHRTNQSLRMVSNCVSGAGFLSSVNYLV